jgi:hypothetical protein
MRETAIQHFYWLDFRVDCGGDFTSGALLTVSAQFADVCFNSQPHKAAGDKPLGCLDAWMCNAVDCTDDCSPEA